MSPNRATTPGSAARSPELRCPVQRELLTSEAVAIDGWKGRVITLYEDFLARFSARGHRHETLAHPGGERRIAQLLRASRTLDRPRALNSEHRQNQAENTHSGKDRRVVDRPAQGRLVGDAHGH